MADANANNVQNPDGTNLGDNNQNPQNNQQPNGQQANTQPPVIDYEKLSSIIAGKQSTTEDSVLKGYFKQQGLSKEEAEQAIAAFKEQKAANQPDIGAMQQEITQANAVALQAQIENKALLMHQELGVDLTTIPYLIKLADLSQVAGDGGTVDDEKLKEALTKVLADVPQLKQQENTASGFRQVGAAQGSQQHTETNTKPTAQKRWNRFN